MQIHTIISLPRDRLGARLAAAEARSQVSAASVGAARCCTASHVSGWCVYTSDVLFIERNGLTRRPWQARAVLSLVVPDELQDCEWGNGKVGDSLGVWAHCTCSGENHRPRYDLRSIQPPTAHTVLTSDMLQTIRNRADLISLL